LIIAGTAWIMAKKISKTSGLGRTIPDKPDSRREQLDN
jgi:hypothetical protein